MNDGASAQNMHLMAHEPGSLPGERMLFNLGNITAGPGRAGVRARGSREERQSTTVSPLPPQRQKTFSLDAEWWFGHSPNTWYDPNFLSKFPFWVENCNATKSCTWTWSESNKAGFDQARLKHVCRQHESSLSQLWSSPC